MGKIAISKPDLEVILGGGSLLQGVNLVRRLTGMDLVSSKQIVEKFRGGSLSWREYFEASDPCAHCEGTGFGKEFAVGQQLAPDLVVAHEDTLRMLREQADAKNDLRVALFQADEDLKGMTSHRDRLQKGLLEVDAALEKESRAELHARIMRIIGP